MSAAFVCPPRCAATSEDGHLVEDFCGRVSVIHECLFGDLVYAVLRRDLETGAVLEKGVGVSQVTEDGIGADLDALADLGRQINAAADWLRQVGRESVEVSA